MEFKITGKYNETYLEECLNMWKFSSKEAYNNVKTYSICCLVYLTFGLLYYLRGKPISLLISSFGLACFLMLIIQILNIYQLKRNTKKSLSARIDKYKNDPTALRELFFTEDCIKYCDPEMLLELKWPAFSHYQEYKNYIFFFLKESKKLVLSMDKNNIPESIEKNLFVLINSKICVKN
jgi:YcxB-like protein